MKLIILGTLPSLNEYINAERGNKYAAAKMKRDVEAVICWHIKQQLPVKLTRPVILRYLWIEPNKRRDKDNIAFAKKFIQDSLVKMGILKNDGWRYIHSFSDSFDVDAENPRIEIAIMEV